LLDPGEHTVAWSGAIQKVTLAEGQAVTIVVAAAGVGAVAGAPTSGGPAAQDALELGAASEHAHAHDARGGNRAPFWLGVGLTAAATAVGSVAGIVAIGKANEARPGCPGGQCQLSAHGAADEAKTWSTVSTVSFVTAGVLGAATIIVFLLTHDATSATSATKETARLGSLSVSF
jgi:hypothetical protein